MNFPDEDIMTIPDTWAEHLHPRRDLGPVPAAEPGAEALPRWRSRLRDGRAEIEKVLAVVKDAGTAAAARAYLDGAADPLGAAVVALAVLWHDGAVTDPDEERATARYAEVVDAWAAERGVPFAACAFTELQGIAVRRALPGKQWRHALREGRAGEITALWTEGPRDKPDRYLPGWRAGRRMRALLAAASDGDYAAAVERLAALRATPVRRATAAYLVPTERDWVEQWCRERPNDRGYAGSVWAMRFCALSTPEQLAALGDAAVLTGQALERPVLATMAVALGDALAPLVAGALEGHEDVPFDVLAAIPGDASFRLLLEIGERRPVAEPLRDALRRYPVRTLRHTTRLCSKGGRAGVTAYGVLDGWARTEPDLLRSTAPALTAGGRDLVAAALERARPFPEAAADTLPKVLVAPAWTRRSEIAEPVTVPGLKAPEEVAIHWTDGAHKAWAEADIREWVGHYGVKPDWDRIWRPGDWRDSGIVLPLVFAQAPLDVAEPLLPDWDTTETHRVPGAIKRTVARFGMEVYPHVLRGARNNSRMFGEFLLPYCGTEVAALMADWLVRLKAVRRTAAAWLEWHGTAAARMLVPAALGKAGPARQAAEAALRHIASVHGDGAVLSAAGEYGERAAGGLRTLLATDPLDVVPPTVPAVPDWLDPAALPQVLLRGGRTRLPGESVVHLLTILALSPLDRPHPGLRIVRETCDPASLAAFSWAVFAAWRSNGMPSRNGWAFTQLGLIGDDDAARRLTPLLREWPGEGGHARAVTGLDVLAALGTDTALMCLNQIAQRVRYKGLKAKALERIGQIAERLGLTTDQLADRLVPTLDLDAAGALTLDYGPRTFTITFDEALKPQVIDQNGKLRKSLPKPGAKDDAQLAPAAYQRFSQLKKDVRGIASHLVHRLERAMADRRRWTAGEFTELFARHPLTRQVARRLVWLADTGAGTRAFRLAEDLTLADAADDAFALPADARVGIAHPLDLGDDLAAWGQVFADYEIAQPFPQLTREAHRLTAAERAGSRLERFEGLTVPAGVILGLTGRGWERGVPQDAGIEHAFLRPLPGDRYAILNLDPGFVAADVHAFEEHTVVNAFVSGDRHGSGADGTARLGDLDEITASELLRDLTVLQEAAART
ncbi:DUF4132 domain-containing protein [Spirillospora sp. NPDC029432]|uniref:DUF4132 domain-containing protein n=1 Tax=Spirillospora sp. NPDC029432 TaxID=3154599 RepID=UPI003451DBD5